MATVELGMADKVAVLLKAKYTALAIKSKEEVRVERLLRRVAEATRERKTDTPFEVRFWSCTKGMTDRDGEDIAAALREPLQALEWVQKTDERAVYVFRDLHRFYDDAQVLRGIRDTARILKQTPPEKARAIVLLDCLGNLPPELEADVHLVTWPLPKREELRLVLDQAVAALRDEVREAVKKGMSEDDFDAIVTAALGLTAEEAYNAFSRSVVELGRLDSTLIMSDKKNIVAKSGALEWMENLPAGLGDVGDLDEAKEWLTVREEGFSQAARDYGLPTPKGVLLLGVSGGGKTELAKAVGVAWGIPVLRLKVGRIFGSLMGESEEKLTRALETAELVAPCVLVTDEMDKVIGGGSGDNDGGTSARVRGEILTWLQDRTAPVFVVATANNAEEMALRAPELLRKGRWDEIFVDLPTSEGRKSIFDVHVKRRALAGINTPALATASAGFSGAEIAATVTDAMFTAFRDGKRPTSTEDILAEIGRTVPLSTSSKEATDALRMWAKGKTRPASRAGIMKVKPTRPTERRIQA